MRAAHSFKGAARIVNLQAAVRVAHALEDCFVLAQEGTLALHQPEIDLLFRGTDLLLQISKQTEANITRWETDHTEEVQALLGSLSALRQTGSLTTTKPPAAPSPATAEPAHHRPEAPERVVRLTAENLNRLLGLAGESLVESRWLRPFADSLQRLKRHQTELSERLDDLRQRCSAESLSARTQHQLGEVADKVAGCQQFLTDRLQELDLFDRRSAQLSQRLYLEVLRTRMRPFSDGVRRFPRMVRDLARALGKAGAARNHRREHPGGP